MFRSIHIRFENPIMLLLFFLSGLSALIYEVLWLKELTLLFGNTAYSAATTLTVFFLGISMGGYFWGARAGTTKSPLRTYAALELGIGLTALLYFFILDVYYLIYARLFTIFGYHQLLFLSVKFLLSIGLLFFPAFFMGGTFPIMGQHLIRKSEQLGKTGSLLYALNTAGAALGAFAAGFYLPLKLGFSNSYLMAIALNIAIAFAVFLIGSSRSSESVRSSPDNSSLNKPLLEHFPLSKAIIWFMAFLSGFATLSLEVLWTRMFAQVLQNSVYSFSAILVTFLVSLTLGAGLSNILSRLKTSTFVILSSLLALSGLLVGLSPFIFYHLTNGLEALGSNQAWTGYVLSIFAVAAIVILIPGIFIGSVFPYLLKMSQISSEGAGRTIGQLTAINTIGAIAGSLIAGFVLLTYMGLWSSIKLMAIIYFIMAVFVVKDMTKKQLVFRSIPALVFILIISFVYSSGLPLVKLNPQKREKLLEVLEGSHGTVAVVKEGDDLQIKVNNYYNLVSSSAFYEPERWMARIPLFVHPNPNSVFFLGMGTGITAGAALDHPVKKVVVCELIPEVVMASKKYFSNYNNGLFEDKRTRIVIEDGKNYLMGSSDRYDVVVSDIFTPWHAGTGGLYTREHFQAIQSSLKKGGLFALWLTLFQISKTEFSIITKTMLEVFPQVTFWREHFVPGRQIVALIAQNEVQPLDTKRARSNVSLLINRLYSTDAFTDTFPFIFYAGNLTKNAFLFENYPVNTDDRPIIEYQAPITQREQVAGDASWFATIQLTEFLDTLMTNVPPKDDPYLQDLSTQERSFVHAGLSLYKAGVYRKAGMLKKARFFYQDFLARVPVNLVPDLK